MHELGRDSCSRVIKATAIWGVRVSQVDDWKSLIGLRDMIG